MGTQILSARDVAKRSRRRMEVVLDWLASGQLPAERSGNRWRVLESDLETFLRERAREESEQRKAAASTG